MVTGAASGIGRALADAAYERFGAVHVLCNNAGVAGSGREIGTPDTIRENMRQHEERNLDVLIFTAQAGDRKHEHLMEAIELFGTQVLPDFNDRHETKHRKWRDKQLAGVDFPINSSI